MGKPHSHCYLFAGYGGSTGTMVCETCKEPIFSHAHDWMSQVRPRHWVSRTWITITLTNTGAADMTDPAAIAAQCLGHAAGKHLDGGKMDVSWMARPSRPGAF